MFGPLQTAQRGEVTALAHALTINGRKTILTDSRYVHDTVKKLQRGHPIAGAHRDLWTLIHPYIDQVQDIIWVKAHLDQDEALKRGTPLLHWDLNRQADASATRGLNTHTHTHGRPRALDAVPLET